MNYLEKNMLVFKVKSMFFHLSSRPPLIAFEVSLPIHSEHTETGYRHSLLSSVCSCKQRLHGKGLHHSLLR